jgi:hypothetical protein
VYSRLPTNAEVKMFKKISKFKNEDEEREFWAVRNSTDYIDWSQAKRVVMFKHRTYKLRIFISDIKRLPKTIKYGVDNLIYWFRIIWNDRYWEQEYFYAILAHKLISMERNLELCDPDETATINAARIALERLRDDVYDSEAFESHEKKWGKLETKFVWDENHKRKVWVSSRPNAITDEEKEEEHKGHFAAHKQASSLRDKDIKCFTDIIRDNVLDWWD